MESRKKEQEQAEYRQPEALNEKIADVSKTIFSYCMAKTPNRVEAEDLCQDILCELVRSSGNIRDSRAFYGFMWAVAGNVYRQWCRKKAGQQTCELTEDLGRFINGGYIPVRILTDRKILCTDWNPLEMPTTQIRLNMRTGDEA